jgi:hypothetical protein
MTPSVKPRAPAFSFCHPHHLLSNELKQKILHRPITPNPKRGEAVAAHTTLPRLNQLLTKECGVSSKIQIQSNSSWACVSTHDSPAPFCPTKFIKVFLLGRPRYKFHSPLATVGKNYRRWKCECAGGGTRTSATRPLILTRPRIRASVGCARAPAPDRLCVCVALSPNDVVDSEQLGSTTALLPP